MTWLKNRWVWILAAFLFFMGMLELKDALAYRRALLDIRVDSLENRADSLFASANGYRKEADSLRKIAVKKAASRPVITLPTEEAPDTCEPYLAERDTVIEYVLGELEVWESIVGKQDTALRKVDTLVVTKDRIVEVYKEEARKSFWKKLVPEVQAGAFGGMCTDGAPCAGVGLSLGWRVF